MEKFAFVFVLYLIGFVMSLIILVMENIFKPSRPNVPWAYDVRFEALQKELENLAVSNGIKISGDFKSGWIVLKK